jgi:hypothetical protein
MDTPIMTPTGDPKMTRPPLPDAVVEQLAEFWCEAILANLRRHPIAAPERQVS